MSDEFLFNLSKLYSGGRTLSFEADRPFLFHIYDRQLNSAILSGRLKEFEGEKSKFIDKLGGLYECYDADGKEIPCRNFV